MAGLDPRDVSVVIPTRGDVDLSEIIKSLAAFDEVLIWDNSEREDLSVYGRYAMIAEARNDFILTQDDDCVLAPETLQALLACATWVRDDEILSGALVANMPERFRAHYIRSCLVGFGAIFDRGLPERAFGKFTAFYGDAGWPTDWAYGANVLRECDSIVATLSKRVVIDVPYRDLPWASAPNRLWKQPGHGSQRKQMLDLARRVRDGS